MPALLTGSQGKEDARHAKDLGDLLLFLRLETTCCRLQNPVDSSTPACIRLNQPVEQVTHMLSSWARSVLVPRWVCRGVFIWGNPLLLSFEAFAKEKPKTCNSI